MHKTQQDRLNIKTERRQIVGTVTAVEYRGKSQDGYYVEIDESLRGGMPSCYKPRRGDLVRFTAMVSDQNEFKNAIKFEVLRPIKGESC